MKDIEKGCEGCGKRLPAIRARFASGRPARNNQRNLECTKQGLCRECYENAYLVCEKCGCDLPKGQDPKSLAAKEMSYCPDCYEEYKELNRDDDSAYGYGWLESVRQTYDETDEYER